MILVFAIHVAHNLRAPRTSVVSGGGTPARTSPHHLRRKVRATAGSVLNMATGTARSLVGRLSGRFATT